MLLKSNKTCKYKLAIVIRVIFVLCIPVYYIFTDNLQEEISIHDVVTGQDRTFTTRHLLSDNTIERNCTPPAILEFPSDGLTKFQRQHGFIIIHCVAAMYCFLFLGAVCERYLVPAIEILCERLNVDADIAGATFMAAASSSPELFVNCIGTFVTEGDLGVSTIVGSAVFNILAVPAFCAFLAGRVIELDWWAISRDSMVYALSVVALIMVLLDGKVFWYEALLLVLMNVLYILAMVYNSSIGYFARSGCCSVKKSGTYTEISPLIPKLADKAPFNTSNGKIYTNQVINEVEEGLVTPKRHGSAVSIILCIWHTTRASSTSSLWSWPDEMTSKTQKLFWILMWPMCFLLWFTIPDCKKHQRLYPLTLFMSIMWIGGASYLIAWIITVIGDTLNVPDSITGLTILAAGTSLPEAISSILVTIQGHGTMGISNTIASNTFDILFCLGLPWLIKSVFYPSHLDNHWVNINSSGLSYSAISLLSTLIVMYLSLVLNKFHLDWKVGATCTLIYAGYLLQTTLIELNTFFVVNLPVCPH